VEVVDGLEGAVLLPIFDDSAGVGGVQPFNHPKSQANDWTIAASMGIF
jgi:hypothetical protein